MTTYNTMNPVPSADARDRYDNSQVFDELMNGAAPNTPDRLGVLRQSWGGMEQSFNQFLINSGFEANHLVYVAGTSLQVLRPTQLIDRAGSVYRVKMPATFPVMLSGNWVSDAAIMVDVGDQSLLSMLSATDGANHIGWRGRTAGSRFDDYMNIKDSPNAVIGDGSSSDRLNFIAKLDAAAAAGTMLVVPAGVWSFNDWIPLPDKCKLWFMPGSVLKLIAETSSGGFVCGGYTPELVPRPFTDVEIYGMHLDCNSIAGENGFAAVNASNVKVYDPKIRNTVFSTTKLGGRAFQFEGAVVDGVHVFSPYIENCSIGCNSQGDPSGGTEKARDINYYDVVMRNVDVPFNVDGQFVNPHNGSLENCSTFVHGAALNNCGKLTFPGAASPQGGGIICGDRGYGLSISGLRVYNTLAYGGIGGVTRGTMFNVSLTDARIDVPSATAVHNFEPCGFGAPSGADWPNLIYSELTYVGNLDYVIKTGGSAGRIGASSFNVAINAAKASLGGIVDVAGVSTAYLDLSVTDLNFKRTRLRSLADIYAAGNSVGVCQQEYTEGPWTPVDASGAALVLTGISGYFVRNGRQVTATFNLSYPTTSSALNAIIGGLPFMSANFSTAGAVTIGYKSATNFNSALVPPSSGGFSLFTNAGAPTKNLDMSGTTVQGTVVYLAES